MMTIHNDSVMSEDSDEIVTANGELTGEWQDEADLVMEIGELTLTMCIIEPGGHLLVIYETARQKTTLEFMVAEESEGYDTRIFLNGALVHQDILDGNLLEPISRASPDGVKQTASEGDISPLSPQYTYSWWDGVRQVTGPSYLIKYHHPDRDYYQIAPWNDWSREGYQTFHNQINEYTSGLLIAGGWGAVFAAIAAVITHNWGPWATGAAILITWLFGVVFEYTTGYYLGDEEGCIWWWWGVFYHEWFLANIVFLVTNPLGWGAALGGFLKTGYIKIGAAPPVDFIGIGSP
jgi:hypothetical protein